MFEKLIESLLGDWGPVALNFVYKYQVFISIAVVAWGITMIVVRRRRKKKTTEEENNNQGDINERT